MRHGRLISHSCCGENNEAARLSKRAGRPQNRSAEFISAVPPTPCGLRQPGAGSQSLLTIVLRLSTRPWLVRAERLCLSALTVSSVLEGPDGPLGEKQGDGDERQRQRDQP
jgi:hypothetical protein